MSKGPSKTCPKCGEEKPLDDFHRLSRGVQGRHAQCKECRSATAKALRRCPEARKKHRKRAYEHRTQNPRKVCKTCGEEKSISEFSPAAGSTTRDGLRSTCKVCRAAAVREQRKDPEFVERERARARKYYRENQRKIRARRYELKYGISWKDALALLRSQDYKCACCGVELTPKNRALDHRHDSGAVAGWTCQSCNSALGLLGDGHDLSRIEKLLEYAKRTRHDSHDR